MIPVIIQRISRYVNYADLFLGRGGLCESPCAILPTVMSSEWMALRAYNNDKRIGPRRHPRNGLG